MEIIYQQDERLLRWCGERLGVVFPEDSITLACADWELLAVVVYRRFSKHNCEMSIASIHPRWCSRRFLRAAFTYPFKQCELSRVTFVTTADNPETLVLLDRLGAKEEGVLRNWFGEKDGIIYGLLRQEAERWL